MTTITATTTRTTTNAPAIRAIMSPEPPFDLAGTAWAGTHVWPFQCHRRSCEAAGFQHEPYQPQNPFARLAPTMAPARTRAGAAGPQVPVVGGPAGEGSAQYETPS